MPVYRYECLDCDKHFEAHYAVDERHRARCPSCRSHETQILVGDFYSFTRTPGFAPISKMREWDKKAKARGSELVVVGRDEAD